MRVSFSLSTWSSRIAVRWVHKQMGCFQSQQWMDIHYIDPLCITTAFYILLHRHSHISADSPDFLHIKTPLSPCRGDSAAEALLIGQKRSSILLLISVVFLTGDGPGERTWQSLIRGGSAGKRPISLPFYIPQLVKSLPFIALKPEKGTPFGRSLPV